MASRSVADGPSDTTAVMSTCSTCSAKPVRPVFSIWRLSCSSKQCRSASEDTPMESGSRSIRCWPAVENLVRNFSMRFTAFVAMYLQKQSLRDRVSTSVATTRSLGVSVAHLHMGRDRTFSTASLVWHCLHTPNADVLGTLVGIVSFVVW